MPKLNVGRAGSESMHRLGASHAGWERVMQAQYTTRRIAVRVPTLLQIGANSHGDSLGFLHDPAPKLISKHWAAVLLEPQPGAAMALRRRYAGNRRVRVVQAALCRDGSPPSMVLYFVNGSRTLGSNESDVRCMFDDAISGTASFSRAHVVAHQRWYRSTPSQCAKCSALLGRPLPPTCMSRVYTANLDSIDVPCASVAQLLSNSNDERTDATQRRLPRAADFVVVDTEGADDMVVARYLQLAPRPPALLMFERTFIPGKRWKKLFNRLRAAGLQPFNWTGMRSVPRGSELRRADWRMLRAVLWRRLRSRDFLKENSVWALASTEPARGGAV